MIPVRKSKKGTRPDLSDKEIRSLKKVNEDDRTASSKWEGTRKELSEKEKRKIFGRMMELAATTCMENHVYQHSGKIYRQTTGMPIGLMLSGVVAELRMCDWLEVVD